MSDGDFEPEGWSAFDDHGTHGEKGNAGCALFFIVIAVVAIVAFCIQSEVFDLFEVNRILSDRASRLSRRNDAPFVIANI